jgi:putative lipoic acid-binding regulatory protein
MEGIVKPELKFPVDFPLRIIGVNEEGFKPMVLEILHRHVPDLDETTIHQRLSNRGKYCSVSVRFVAQTRQQVDELYSELGRNKNVKCIL